MLMELADKMDRTEDSNKDWRDGLGSQKEVMGHIYTHQLFPNSVLMLGEENTPFKVIKENIQSLSIILEQRLTSSNEKDLQGLAIFHLNDISVDSMTQLIKFAYTHELDWSWSGEFGSLTSLLSLKKVAEEFKIKKLIPKIESTIELLITNQELVLNPQNACQFFQKAISAGEEALKNVAFKFILREANRIFLNVENYKMLSERDLIEIVKDDELEVGSELELFRIVLKWGKAKCVEMQQNENENLEQILKEILKWIRFTQMTRAEFVDQVQTTNILGMDEIVEIRTKLNLIIEGTSSSVPEREKPRKWNPHSAVHKVDQLDQKESIKLIQVVHQSPIDLQIQFDSVVSAYDLIIFLQSTSSTTCKLSLIVDSIVLSISPSSVCLKFPQLSSLHFASLETNTQLECLIQIVNNSPNLRKLSIGNFEYFLNDAVESSSNMLKFLNSVTLKNVNFSCGLIEDQGFNINLLRKLKGNGVSIKKLGLNFRGSDRDTEILEYLNQDLEEIHLLKYFNENFPLGCSFLNLKVLSVWCGNEDLLNILKSCPNIQQLGWCPKEKGSRSKTEKIVLNHLTSLSLNFCHGGSLAVAIGYFFTSPNLNELTIMNAESNKWTGVFKTFPHIKKLSVVSGDTVTPDYVIEMEDEEYMHQSSEYQPYDGNLKELTSLSFGYKQHLYESVDDFYRVWEVHVKRWAYKICHLPKLTHLQLSPISLNQAIDILDVLESHCKQLKSVEFQVWNEQNEELYEDKEVGEAMTMSEVDQLFAYSHNRHFKVEKMIVDPLYGRRQCYF